MRRKRQWGLLPEETLSQRVTVIGAGGIGSWTTLLLAKMGLKHITVVDFDVVEDHNVASQLYDESQVDFKKVNALQLFVERNVGTPIKGFSKKFDSSMVDEGEIVIIGVDSIESRKEIAEQLKFKLLRGIIDGRMGGEQVEVYTYKTPIDYYQDIMKIEKASEDPCTARSIVYNTNMCGSLIVAQVKKLLCNQPVYKNLIFDLASMSFIRSKFHD